MLTPEQDHIRQRKIQELTAEVRRLKNPAIGDLVETDAERRAAQDAWLAAAKLVAQEAEQWFGAHQAVANAMWNLADKVRSRAFTAQLTWTNQLAVEIGDLPTAEAKSLFDLVTASRR